MTKEHTPDPIEYQLEITQEELDIIIAEVEAKLSGDEWWELNTPLKGWAKTKAFMKRVLHVND